jgi:hypothetical protein
VWDTHAERLRAVCHVEQGVRRAIASVHGIEPIDGWGSLLEPILGVQHDQCRDGDPESMWWDHAYRVLWPTGGGMALIMVYATGEEGDAIDAALADLELAMVNLDAYSAAIAAGQGAIPPEFEGLTADEVRQVLERVVGHVRGYAKGVPDTIAGRIREVIDRFGTDDGFAAALDEQLEAFRSSVTRYAEPTWTAGNQSYGEGLDANEVQLLWTLDGAVENCSDCEDLAAEGPYTSESIPTWPKGGDTICLDRCYCSVEADPETFDQALGQAKGD